MIGDNKVLLLDIEGTTTSISFVRDTLFPHVRRLLPNYLKNTFSTEETQADLKEISKLTDELISSDQSLCTVPKPDLKHKSDVIHAVIHNVNCWMDLDLKEAALKQLQGHIWHSAYTNGEIKGHVFADVAPALRRLATSCTKIYIYSSGSVAAQKLLFGYSKEGDLTPLISGHFDTKIGLKVEVQSYKNIAEEIGVEADKILFLTDVEREAFPATEAGMNCILVVRPGNEAISDKAKEKFQTINSFDVL